MGGNYTALARGYAAVGFNPANLALPGAPGFSLAVAPVRAGSGIGPIGFGEIADYEGKLLPRSVQVRWMDAVERAGGLTGSAGAEVTELALSMNRIGFQVSTVARGDVALGPDAVELILFGNAGRTGSTKDFTLRGSRLDGFAATTFAAGYALPVRIGWGPAGSFFAVGATVKYTIGHALVMGRDAGSSLTSDPVSVDVEFPVILPDFDGIDSGSGLGLDVGAAWQWKRWTAGAAVQNLVQSFSWNLDDYAYRPGSAFFDENDSGSDFDERPAREAPASLRREFEQRDFDPRLSVGVAWRARPDLTVTGDLRHELGSGLRVEERTHLGAGAEFRPIPLLALRGGLAAVSGGFQFAAGAGVALGPVRVSAAVSARTGDDDLTTGMVGLSFGTW